MNARQVLLLGLAMTAVVGCSLNRSSSALRQDIMRIGRGQSGQIIEPKRCLVTVAILSRPINDTVINDALWRSADEQVVEPSTRRALEDNGLRVGLLTGKLPNEVDEIVIAPPPHKLEPAQYFIPEGVAGFVSLGPPVPHASLFLNRNGQATGKQYQDASGRLRVTTHNESVTKVTLRIVPEILHGPIKQAIGSIATGGTYSPQMMTIKNGQEEETIRELAANLNLQPDQAVVIGCRPDKPHSLGSFLLTEREANSDRITQKVVLMWALQGKSGLPDHNAPPSPPTNLVPIDPPKPAESPNTEGAATNGLATQTH